MKAPLAGMRIPPFVAARWRNVALLSWPVEDAVLEPLLPTGLILDRWGGDAYISLVGLWFQDVRICGLPSPLREYEEVNLRFYVRRPTELAGGQPGVVFIRQLVPHRITAWVAGFFYGEPFMPVRMCHRFENSGVAAQDDRTRIAYGWRFQDRSHGFWVEGVAPAGGASEGSLDEFLTARYWGYNGKPGARTRAYRLVRPEWLTGPAVRWELNCDAADLYGPALGRAMAGPPQSALLASGSAASVHWPRRLPRDSA